MSRAKQRSDVEDMSIQTDGSVGPTDPFGVVHQEVQGEVDHKFISLKSFAMDRNFRNFLDIPRT
jgi:hypothetical protein